MNDGKPDTTPPARLIEESLLPSLEESKKFPDEQLSQFSPAENIGCDCDAYEPILNNSDGADITGRCEAEAVETSARNEREKFVHQVSIQVEKNEHEKVTVNSEETNCTYAQNNKDSTSEVAEVLEKIVSDVNSASESNSLPTAQDENNAGDAIPIPIQNTKQLQSENVSAAEDEAPTKVDENKDGDFEELQTSEDLDAPTKTGISREILFTNQGWSQRWAAISDKQLSFTAPVLRVEAGRFFWSSETYNKR